MTVVALTATSVRGAGMTGAQQPDTASLAGVVETSTAAAVPNATLRLRNLATNSIEATSTTAADGSFGFLGLPAGNYVLEAGCQSGEVFAVTGTVAIISGAAIRNLIVRSGTRDVCLAAAAVLPAAAAVSATTVDTALIVTAVAAAAGVATIVTVAVSGKASPSR